MKLPDGDRAIVAIEKLRDYCLNPDNPRGSNKARVFLATLGLTSEHAEDLRSALLIAASSESVSLGELDIYGQRYTLDFTMTTSLGSAKIRSGWIILVNEDFPRLTTCYVMKQKEESLYDDK